MLRITEQRSTDRVVLKLEGQLSGEWVTEVEACWHAARAAGDVPIWVDVKDVWQVDAAGSALLGQMCRDGVEFTTRGCLMKELIRDAVCSRSS